MIDREVLGVPARKDRNRVLELCARELDADVGCLRALELGFCGIDICQGGDAGLDLVPGDREGCLERLDGVGIQVPLLIGCAQLEIVLRQRDLGR